MTSSDTTRSEIRKPATTGIETTGTESRRAHSRKPFLDIEADVDDDALERMARAKGVPALKPLGDAALPASAANDPVTGRAGGADPVEAEIAPPTPRARRHGVKVAVPDYALTALKTRAIADNVTLGHLLLKGLQAIGIDIHDDDMIEDGRRVRGNRTR